LNLHNKKNNDYYKRSDYKSELTDYIKFPFSLQRNNEFWVPPIIADELEPLTKRKSCFKSAEAYFYLAYRNNEIVGRISAIVNWGEVNDQQKKKVRFGWFDVLMTLK
jgi:hypothetical protein